MVRGARLAVCGGLALVVVACSAADGNSGVGRRRADGGGVVRLADGALVGPDGEVLATGDGGGIGGGDDTGTQPGADDAGTGGPGDPDGGGGLDSDGGTGTRSCTAEEICGNGLDDDCRGGADDTCPCNPGDTQRCYEGNAAQAGVGVCTWGTQTCDGAAEFAGWTRCTGQGSPQPTQCGSNQDTDCSGVAGNEPGCVCTVGATQACYTGPAGTRGVGQCGDGMATCVVQPDGTSDWGPCMGEITPSMELCDGRDYDCDGATNSGCGCVVGASRSCYAGAAGTAGTGVCRAGSQRCERSGATSAWSLCAGEVLPSPDTCDGIDRDCDGNANTGCVCMVGATRPCYSGAAATRRVGTCRDGTNTCVASGATSDWSAACAGEQPPVNEICGNRLDDNCNGAADEGCAGSIMCPGMVIVDAGVATPTFTATATSDVGSIGWTITSGPTGGIATVRPASSGTGASGSFNPTIVGDYNVRFSGRDAAGNTVACDFLVRAEPHGLRVELTWNGSGDVDLHMHNATNSSWFSGDDCYFSNRTPAWGPGANLDFDNTSSSGPENIRIDAPTQGTDFTVAVHNWSGGAGRIATIKIFCGDTNVTPTQTFVSRALTGTGSGANANDFWRVARVRFTSRTTCTITPIDTYQRSTNSGPL